MDTAAMIVPALVRNAFSARPRCPDAIGPQGRPRERDVTAPSHGSARILCP
jgi:hypothetical protein